MAAVLGIDAAWTERNASGYALIEREAGRWRIRAAASDLAAFCEACGLSRREGQGASLALACAEHALGGRLPDLASAPRNARPTRPPPSARAGSAIAFTRIARRAATR